MLTHTPRILIFGKPDCKYCEEAKKAFTSVELEFEYGLLEEMLCLPDEDGNPRKLPEDWRTSGMVELQAMYSMCGDPVPFIVVDGQGCRNLSVALDLIHYRDRKKALVKRKRDAQKADPRPDA